MSMMSRLQLRTLCRPGWICQSIPTHGRHREIHLYQSGSRRNFGSELGSICKGTNWTWYQYISGSNVFFRKVFHINHIIQIYKSIFYTLNFPIFMIFPCFVEVCYVLNKSAAGVVGGPGASTARVAELLELRIACSTVSSCADAAEAFLGTECFDVPRCLGFPTTGFGFQGKGKGAKF